MVFTLLSSGSGLSFEESRVFLIIGNGKKRENDTKLTIRTSLVFNLRSFIRFTWSILIVEDSFEPLVLRMTRMIMTKTEKIVIHFRNTIT